MATPIAPLANANSANLDIFQPGLIRGQQHLPFDPVKAYFYVEHPTELWRVYLRGICFIHEEGIPFDPKRFLVVKRTGANPLSRAWEPPKGQMEGKDGIKHLSTGIERLIKDNVRREVYEEAHIGILHNLRHTGLVFQARESDYSQNTYFQYHVFQATTPTSSIQRALNWFAWLKDHPKYFARMKCDKKEKDAIRWFDPRETQVMGKWSPAIVAMYIQRFDR
jgi:8-oxo-dGTP pyrophosphatase MutT (NUDIX family)